MRLIKQNIERNGAGFVTLFPEEPEDMVRTFDASLESVIEPADNKSCSRCFGALNFSLVDVSWN
jgi:hypothetical protein